MFMLYSIVAISGSGGSPPPGPPKGFKTLVVIIVPRTMVRINLTIRFFFNKTPPITYYLILIKKLLLPYYNLLEIKSILSLIIFIYSPITS